jgi:hypothetical protein
MTRYTISQKNVWPYLIGPGLVAVAILVSWLVIQNSLAISLPADSGLSIEAPGPAVIDPADRKFFNGRQTVLPTAERVVDSFSNLDPADRKFFTVPDITASVLGVAEFTAAVDPADRKFFYGGHLSGDAVSGSQTHLLNIDPADRKFFGGGYVDGAKVTTALGTADRNSSSGN